MIVALAGRRIDAPDAKMRRFPLENVDLVRQRIRSFLAKEKPVALVCSAANGADLLALDAAMELGIERHFILPFAAEVFRRTSVVDRPGPWGKCFDRVTADLSPNEEVIYLNYPEQMKAAYVATNQAILERAQRLASAARATLLAGIVWEGFPKQEHDVTAEFKRAAHEIGIPVREISTL